MKDMGARIPVDRTSALVVSEGTHWTPEIPQSCVHDSEFPIPTSHRDPKTPDLSGLRVGRLTVLGYWGRHNDQSRSRRTGTAAKHRWVVRCDCGMYSVRRATSLTKTRARHDDDCCDRCKHLDRIRKNYVKR